MDMTNNNYFNNFVADYTTLNPTNENRKLNSCNNIAEHHDNDDETVCASNITTKSDDCTASTADCTDDESMTASAQENGATKERTNRTIK
jgi:hypothetical protein